MCEIKLRLNGPNLDLGIGVVDVDGNGSLPPGQTVKASVYKKSANRWFDFTAGTFTLVAEPVTLETIPHTEDGSYEKVLNTGAPTDEDYRYRVHVILASTGTGPNRDYAVPVEIEASSAAMAELLLIKERTDNLPDDPTSETQAAINAAAIIGEINENEVKIDDILAALAGTLEVNVIEISGQSTFDGLSLELIQRINIARILGRFKKNVPLMGDITYYEYANQTEPFFVMHATTTERTRLVDPT